MNGALVPSSLLTESSDEQLMEMLKAHETEALGILFNRYCRLVFNIACKIVRDRAEAEDVMQQVFVEVYVDAAKFDRDRGTFKTWLLQYAYHRSINRRKYLNTRGLYDVTAAHPTTPEIANPAPQRAGLSSQDWANVIRQALQQLHEKERQAIELACFEGLEFPEIARQMCESLPNARNRFYRGLKKLRALIGVERASSGYVCAR